MYVDENYKLEQIYLFEKGKPKKYKGLDQPLKKVDCKCGKGGF